MVPIRAIMSMKLTMRNLNKKLMVEVIRLLVVTTTTCNDGNHSDRDVIDDGDRDCIGCESQFVRKFFFDVGNCQL